MQRYVARYPGRPKTVGFESTLLGVNGADMCALDIVEHRGILRIDKVVQSKFSGAASVEKIVKVV
jgi:hypothetical protein